MSRFLIKDAAKHIGEKIKVAGWVNVRRAHGKILFIDLRDISGILQVVFVPSNEQIYKLAEQLRPEWVVEITGQIIKRPEKMINPKIETGQVEMSAESLIVLSESGTLPFPVEGDGYDINEEIRMKYRYVDLRRERLKNNLIMRHKVIKFMRDFLSNEGFIEIETPILTKSTPEGSRDFLVPSRLNPGKFYALPQSPQQYKQLLMAAGFEKYFQIARCLRDEDPRGDRQFEHTQLDVEMSFVEREDVMELTERMLITLIKNFYSNKKIQEIPFPRLSYEEAMKKYKSDKPDIRKDKNDPDLLAFCWIVDFPFFEKTDSSPTNFEEEGGKQNISKKNTSKLVGDKGKWTFTHNPFSAAKREFKDDLLNKKNIENILTSQYDIVLNGAEIGGGSIRNHTPDALKKVFEIMGYKKDEIKEKFGHMMDAFIFGTPPHGGIAPGIDRIVAILQNEPNIREVIAFPKTGDGRDLMMSSPDEVSKKQLEELHIKISNIKAKPTPKRKVVKKKEQ
ncbi:MAG: aspartate--tRNA ligase [bacterium]